MIFWENTCTSKCKEKKHSSTCRSRKSRQSDPIKYYYTNLKSRAKQRPKEFTISLEYFRQWCKDVNFVIGEDSVDRVKNELGYIEGNLAKLPLIENIRKYWDFDREKKGLPPITQGELEFEVEKIKSKNNYKPMEIPDENLPF